MFDSISTGSSTWEQVSRPIVAGSDEEQGRSPSVEKAIAEMRRQLESSELDLVIGPDGAIISPSNPSTDCDSSFTPVPPIIDNY